MDMRSFLLPLLVLAATTAISFAEEMTVSGILKQAKDKETQSEYFVIETAKLVTKGSVKDTLI